MIDDYLARVKGKLRSYRDYARYRGCGRRRFRATNAYNQIVPGDIEPLE